MLNANTIVAWSRGGGFWRRRFGQAILVFFFSFDLPPEVEVEKDVVFLHNALGTVIHPKTTIKKGAMICQGVTIGDANMHTGLSSNKGEMRRIVICENVTICAGAQVLCKNGELFVGKGTIVGANAVLTKSTGERQVWAGVPARLIR